MINNITPKQAKEMLESGEAILVDVRDTSMFQADHIDRATSIPLESLPQQLTQLSEQPKKIIFQCMRGIKSQQACSLALNANQEVYNLDGGINAWKEAGLPTISSQVSPSVTNTNNTCSGMPPSLIKQMQITLGIVLLIVFLLIKLGLGFLFYLIPIIGIVLIIAGITGCCPLIKLLSKMPWNKF